MKNPPTPEERAFLSAIAQTMVRHDGEPMFVEVLRLIREKFSSEFGYFGYINDDGDLVCPSMTRDIWDRCQVEEKSIVFPKAVWGGMWGRSLERKVAIYSTGELQVPEGHVPLRHAIAVPVMIGDQLIGQFALANSDKPYGDDELRLLEELADDIAPILKARLERDREERVRKEAEQALTEAKEELERRIEERTASLSATNQRLSTLIDNLHSAVLVESEQRRILYANQQFCDMWQIPAAPAALVGADFSQNAEQSKALTRDPESFVERLEDLLDKRRLVIADEIEMRDGRILERDYVPIFVDDAYHGHLWHYRDVTERHNAERALRQSQRLEATANLAAGIAHEFNNLMTIVSGNVSLLRIGGESPKEENDLYEEVLSAVERGATLSNQMVAYARTGAFFARPLVLSDQVAITLKLLEQTFPDRVTLQQEYADEHVTIRADATLLAQLVTAVCKNAVEAIDGAGNVTVCCNSCSVDATSPLRQRGVEEGHFATLSIRDTGRGIPQDVLPHIFEPFFSTKFVGRGLGLSAAFGIVKNHQGFLLVDSELGEGTTVTAYLPVL
jgi:two-component system cell cycle sensor histidine kinase/response regulator CckA